MTHRTAYIPLHALRKIDIQSILSIALPSQMNENENKRRYDYHNSRRTMLHFLLSMFETPNNQQLMNLINECNPRIDWDSIKNTYMDLKTKPEPYQEQYHAEKFDDYWEENYANRPGPRQSQQYILKYREKGFQPEELKLYWNYQEIESLHKNGYFNPITDTDTKEALKAKPVDKRANFGAVKFHQSGIEKAVFKVEKGRQIIVLDFADERMPGGYFLENARTQEEVILFNSDGYRALLDLKYKTMDGGYILPEYGLAYIKQVRFFQKPEQKNPQQEKTQQEEPLQERVTDLIVAACYDLSGAGEGLYKPPSHGDYVDLYDRTKQKFRAIIASAVANTEGDGSSTCLLLGPIGTGAFGNDEDMIAEIFCEILNNPLMGSKEAIRYAFEQIWFVSIDRLDVFEEVFAEKDKLNSSSKQ
ncbi:unnamed protein product [Adineta steineri]|uniref:Microbial-type PARG catalytic domain-containing protein n=1 Tax=Adineta steineri TaxID=433720 RepID=A0A815TK37_9BILA|nr:unnamed protein product [Adineta steineri]CAF3930222.1 unnamed protein product [Adineta steineri]